MEQQSDPTPAPARLPHLPALDGVRALALLGVLGFHAGFEWMRGGYLPLTAFFVLSGFLITSILLLEHQGTGRIDRRTFWVRRARRLVPGALLGVTLAAASVLATGADLPRFRGDALSALVWLTNWRFIDSGQSYGDLFADPSPLQHYWSLAIEEQFYLVLPLLAGAFLLRPGRRGRGRSGRNGAGRGRWPFAVAVSVLAVASVVTMRVLHQPGDEPLRTYYGTDTRAAELLIGVLLAMLMIGRQGLRRVTGAGRVAVEVAGVVGLVGSVALWCTVTQYDDWLFEGGLAAVALLSAAIVLAASQTGTVVSRLLGSWPMAALGRISYGAYLYHWPLFIWISPERTGLDTAPLFAVRMAATIALATLSYRYVEQPIREGRLPRPVGPLAWANGAVAVMALVALVAAVPPDVNGADEITLAAEGVVVQAAPPPPPDGTTSTPGTEAADPTAPTTGAPTGGATPATATPAEPGQAGPARQVRPRAGGTGGAGGGASSATTDGATASPTAPSPGATPAAEPGAPSTPGSSPTSAPAGPAPTSPPPPPPPPKPARVLVLGDSLAQNFAVGLDLRARQAGDMVVWNRGVSGCALGRGGYRWGGAQYPAECSWWASAQARREIDQFKPTVILVVAGLNDIVDRRRDEWGSNYIGPGDPRFDSWLLSEYQAVADAMSRGGVPVVWIPPPCVDWSSGWDDMVGADRNGERRRFHHNGNTIPALRSSRSVRIGDVDGQLCPGGRFDPNALGIENSRPDGLHLTNEASIALADRWLAPLLFDEQR